MPKQRLWLIGAGRMAQFYAAVLEALDIPFLVIGRGDESAARFEAITGHKVRRGGLMKLLSTGCVPERAIVCIGVEQLYSSSLALIDAGTKALLVEKPGGIFASQIKELGSAATSRGTAVYLGYNRRFFSSVRAARRIIEEDGGITLLSFDFTEMGHVIATRNKAPGVKENWILANSTHLLDLAFYFAGPPVEIASWRAGGLNWHPAGSIYAGAGKSETGALFAYTANWGAPGRWGIEVTTPKRRMILRPLEELKTIDESMANPRKIEINDRLDRAFKPGLYRQVSAFMADDVSELCAISEQVEMLDSYLEISGYRQKTSGP